MWVVTRSVNDYNQDGDYLEGIFDHKPSVNELMELLECNEEYAEHVQNGGGRRYFDGVWYFLTEMKSGEKYIRY